MQKPDSLRAALTAAIPDLAIDPDRLRIFVDDGHVASRMGFAPAHPQLSFEYRYRLNALVMDFAGDPDGVMIAIIAWLHVHQPDLLQNHDRAAKAIEFQVDLLDAGKVDLSITLSLTETVRVEPDGQGRSQAVHVPEPAPIPEFDGVPRWTPLREIYRDGQLICSMADV